MLKLKIQLLSSVANEKIKRTMLVHARFHGRLRHMAWKLWPVHRKLRQ